MSKQTIGGLGQGFSKAIEIVGPQRTLYIAGQVGSDEAGNIPESMEAQCDLVWRKIESLLHEGQMTLKDLVKTTAFLTSASDIEAYRKIRAQRIGDNVPAGTLVIVTALVRPEYKVEVEAIASRDA